MAKTIVRLQIPSDWRDLEIPRFDLIALLVLGRDCDRWSR
jgi:hypothetical protein